MILLTDELKKQIDEMSYWSMRSLMRVQPMRSSWFLGDIGKYFGESFLKKEKETYIGRNR